MEIFQNNRDIIRETGWIISEPYSFEWWDGFDTADKIVISAFLVQLTKWESVKATISSLEKANLASIDSIAQLDLPTWNRS